MEKDKYWKLRIDLPNKRNQEVVNDYLLSLKLVNRSKGTIIVYREFLEKFFGNMTESFEFITSDTILHWFLENQGRVKETTRRLRFSILSSFYTFCLAEEYIELSPIKSRWFPRLPQSLPKYMEKEDISKTRCHSEKTPLRNQAIFEFMLTSGCRVSEVTKLNIEDVDLEKRTAKVVGKGKKIREIHFSEKCAILLERYLETHPNKTGAFFVTSTGKRLGTRIIQKNVKKLGQDLKLSNNLHPHRLRHTFATELLSKGAELSFISEELGHTNVSTTQIYARLPKREIIALYRKYMG